jgi:hypothetical protein
MVWQLVTRMLFASVVFATTVGSAGAQTRPIDRFSWLIGGVWKADASSLGNGMKQVATRYQWAPNKAYIEFSTTFTSTKGSVVNYSGSLFESTRGSAAAPAYETWYIDARSAITDGPVSLRSADDWSLAFAGGLAKLPSRCCARSAWCVSMQPLFARQHGVVPGLRPTLCERTLVTATSTS